MRQPLSLCLVVLYSEAEPSRWPALSRHGATPAWCLHAGTAGAPGGPGFCPEPGSVTTARLQNTARGDGWHSLSRVINGCGEIAPWRKQDPKGTARDVQSMWEIEIAALAPK